MTQLPLQNSQSPKRVISIPIDESFISLRSLSPKRIRFEIEYGLERGSTANSFLLFSSESSSKRNTPLLIHPPGETYSEVFLPALHATLPKGTKKLSIIVGHINPNRIALLRNLAKVYPDITIIITNPGAKLLQDLWNRKKPSRDQPNSQEENIPPIPNLLIIKKEQNITFEDDYEFTLMPAPTARWPGGLIVFERNQGLLMSDKFFGAHLCTDAWSEKTSSSTEEDRRHYFDCLMAPMASQVNGIVERLEELDIQTVAPGHGPAIESSWRSLLNDYQRWGERKAISTPNVILLYASAYGNTAAIADALANGVNRTGARIKSLNCEFTSANELMQEIRKADAYLIGSPTLGGHAPTPIVSALGTLLAEGDRQKPVGIFGSYGWSGEAIDLLENKLNDGGFVFGFEPIKIKFSPDKGMIKTLEETGIRFGRTLINKQKQNQRRAKGGITTSRSDPAIVALGRVIGSLCILTVKQGEGEDSLTGAMVASWISQASFKPLGLTIAVAKERAVEVLLHKNNYFALNVLASGHHKNLMQRFLKPFAPGENRFKDLNLEESPNRQLILPDALAWLEGCVNQRMECGDHWLIYAEIKHGKVLDKEGMTAVHHRRTGANY